MLRRGGGAGGLTAPGPDPAPLEAGEDEPFEPIALRALRIALWYLDSATDNSSFVSINVDSVSSSGAGFVALINPCTDRDADRQRSENSFTSSFSSNSVVGVVWIN